MLNNAIPTLDIHIFQDRDNEVDLFHLSWNKVQSKTIEKVALRVIKHLFPLPLLGGEVYCVCCWDFELNLKSGGSILWWLVSNVVKVSFAQLTAIWVSIRKNLETLSVYSIFLSRYWCEWTFHSESSMDFNLVNFARFSFTLVCIFIITNRIFTRIF